MEKGLINALLIGAISTVITYYIAEAINKSTKKEELQND